MVNVCHVSQETYNLMVHVNHVGREDRFMVLVSHVSQDDSFMVHVTVMSPNSVMKAF